jgi:protein SCO1/2
MAVSENSTLNLDQAPSRDLQGGLFFKVFGALAITLLLLIAGGIYFVGFTPYEFHGLLYEPPEPAFDFEFTDQHGQPVHLSDFKDQLVLLYFGFTNCPDACPTTLSTWRRVNKELGSQADEVAYIFITVDPERDTTEKLKKYMELFHPSFMALRGPLDYTEEVAREYSVFMEFVELEESAVEYVVNHSALTFVIDQTGQRVLAYTHDTDVTPQEMAADLKQLLK